MDEQRETTSSGYGGDGRLKALLAAAGSSYDVAGARELIAGVVAAPESQDSRAWTALVADSVSDDLAEELLALRRDMAGPSSLDDRSDRSERLALLRRKLAELGVQGFLIPRADEHQGEYVPDRARRLTWLTGFTGSAGLAVVLARKAAIFVDGRYTLQVVAETDPTLFEPRHVTDEPPAAWIAAHLGKSEVLAYDPWLHTLGEVERYRAAAGKAGGSLQPLALNPLDAVWSDQPPPPLAPVVPHPLNFAGRASAEKRAELAAQLTRDGIDAAILTSPDSIAWLLNIRGGDVPHTPLPLSFAILDAEGRVALFVDSRKLAPGVREHLGAEVEIKAPGDFGPALEKLGSLGKRVLVDPASAAARVFELLEASGGKVHKAADPCVLPKACKNPVELDGTRAAHRRDGAALCRFLAWLSREAPGGALTEIAVSDKLEAFRRPGEHFRDLSFPTISGAGSNGAIVHYRASPQTEKRLEPGTLYLLDSGAQYLDGTTDVTRTMAIGTPTPEMKDRFTRVLKGHIALATSRFPSGTSGSQLDALARLPLWEAGLDFDHGTGHGVGSYLGVHEGPQRISKLPNAQALLPGMIVSDEPGYYKTGVYGIRLENLVAVTPPAKREGGEREMLGFETLTLAPFDLALVDRGLLDDREAAWLDAYHARVRETIEPLVDAETAVWLREATRPISGKK